MNKYQEIAQILDANAIQDTVDAYVKGRADAIDDSFNSLLLMIKNGYDYPNAEFEEMFIALVEDAIDSVKDKLKEQNK